MKVRQAFLQIVTPSLLLCSTVVCTAAPTAPASPPLTSNKLSKYTATAPINHYSASNPHRRISLNFSDIRTRELLQIIAQFTGLNFVLSDNIKGSMSIHLTGIPWPQALKVILTSQGLGQKRLGEIVLIAPVRELAQQEIQTLQAKKQVDALEPLRNQIMTLRYADAEDISKLLSSEKTSLLSTRGQVSVDKRTNSIWLRDTTKHLMTITRLIRKLDIPVKQVMIESRIITIERPYEQQLGARFGVSSPNNLSGTLQGATDLAQGTPAAFVPIADRLNFNVPATPLFGSPAASIGLAVARLGNTLIDLELSALQREGHIELISSPRLVTSNQHTAYIKTGEEIPYEAASSSGATTIEFKDAVLQLKVTPQITADKRVILHITVSNNRAGNPVTLNNGGQAIPIATEEEESTVLVNNHQTIVLGGVYQQDKRKIITRIPFLGALPVIGHLFSHHQDRNDKKELLIFLTPHIVFTPSQLN